jgi:hypothetical protein
MTEYIQFATESGAVVLVEVAEGETDHAGVVRAGLRDRAEVAVSQAKTTFEDGLDILRYNAEAFIQKVRSVSDPPDEVEITFGLKATGEMGNFAVAKAGAEASYTVKLKWKREKSK